MTYLKNLEKTGATDEMILGFGFDGVKRFDPVEEEVYYELYLDGEFVGYTELNRGNGDIEIICETREGFLKVSELVGEKVTVWAWYDNVVTNSN